MDEFIERQRAMWAAATTRTLSRAHRGRRRARRRARQRRRRHATCSTSRAAPATRRFPAARAGAEVTGLDLVPELLEGGRRKAAAEGRDRLGRRRTPRSFRSTTTRSTACSRRSGTCSLRGTADGRRDGARVPRRAASIGDLLLDARGRRPARSSRQPARTCRRRRTSPRRRSSGERRSTCARCSARRPRTSSSSASDDASSADSVEGFADFFVDRFGPLVTAKQMLGARFEELRARDPRDLGAPQRGRRRRLRAPAGVPAFRRSASEPSDVRLGRRRADAARGRGRARPTRSGA